MAASNRKLSKIEQVPDAKFFSVEFPGHVENVDKALEALGGKRAITDATTRRYKVKRRPGSERSLPPYRAPRDDDVPYDKDVEYRFEVVGAIPKTVRFSGLADYQHIVDPKDEIVRIKSDLQNMEYNTDPSEDISMTQIVPPGAISKSGVPHPFRYKARERDDAVKAKPGRKKKPSFRPKKQPGDLTGITPVESNESGDDA
ncbi:General transcription factor 3C polypeptide 5 [Mortierella sp. AD011]|nr:General transcription factor 3C polypeptide 5 [Mortierella sp. AD011]